MGDYKSLPSWKRGMAVAHSVYALVEAAGLKESEAGRRARKAAVAIPSLIGEAFLETDARTPEEYLFLTLGRLAEIGRLMEEEPIASAVAEPDRIALLADLHLLEEELRETSPARPS